MSSVFDPGPEMSAEHIDQAYLSYLDRRDGKMRELRDARLRAALAHGFRANDPLITTSLSKVHQGEEFGVGIFMGLDSAEPLMKRIASQERDHVTILASLIGAFGGQPRTRPMPAILRHFVGLVMRLSERAMTLPLFLSELLGVSIFLAARRHILAHWHKAPRTEQAISLLDDIIVDEVGHVALHHARLKPWQLRVARWLARPFFGIFSAQQPLAAELLRALSRGEFDWSDIPHEILAHAWAPAAKPLENLEDLAA